MRRVLWNCFMKCKIQLLLLTYHKLILSATRTPLFYIVRSLLAPVMNFKADDTGSITHVFLCFQLQLYLLNSFCFMLLLSLAYEISQVPSRSTFLLVTSDASSSCQSSFPVQCQQLLTCTFSLIPSILVVPKMDYFLSNTIFKVFFFLFCWKGRKGRVAGWKIFGLLVHSPNACTSQGQARPKAEARYSFPGPPSGTISFCLQDDTLSERQNCKQKRDPNPGSVAWNVSLLATVSSLPSIPSTGPVGVFSASPAFLCLKLTASFLQKAQGSHASHWSCLAATHCDTRLSLQEPQVLLHCGLSHISRPWLPESW